MAFKGNKHAVGNKGGRGKSLNDRKLAAKVRTLTLNEIFEVLNKKKDYDLYKQILIKLSGTVLPRLTEHTGEDGEKLTITISKEIAEKNGINSTT